MKTNPSARWLMMAPTALLLAATAAVWFGWRDTLPDPVASHFGLDGEPDGAMARNTYGWVALNLGVAGVLVSGAAAYFIRGRNQVGLWAVLGGVVAGLGCGLALMAVVDQGGVATWSAAPSPSSGAVALLLAAVLSGAIASMAAAGRLSRHDALPSVEPAPRLGLKPGEVAVWRRTERSWLLLAAVGLGAMGLAVGAWFGQLVILYALAGLTAALAVAVSSYTVAVGRSGLTLRWGPLGWPMQHVPLAQIRQASAQHIKPMEWGGWGYRGSLALLGQAAVVLRAGPGIRLDLEDDRVFVIGVDDAETGAGLVNDLRETIGQ